MEYSRIISVTGLGGLYELVGSKTDGAIVRSLEDASTRFVSSRIHNFSHLESIEVYTTHDNVNLVEVLNAMKNSTEALPSEKDAAAIKQYFEKVFPAMDFERVYTSDMKKMVRWFSILSKAGIAFEISEVSEEENIEESVPEIVEVKEAEPAKTAKKKAKIAEATTETATEEAPKKKTAKKKTAEE